jgi:hypothetical protein
VASVVNKKILEDETYFWVVQKAGPAGGKE